MTRTRIIRSRSIFTLGRPHSAPVNCQRRGHSLLSPPFCCFMPRLLDSLLLGFTHCNYIAVCSVSRRRWLTSSWNIPWFSIEQSRTHTNFDNKFLLYKTRTLRAWKNRKIARRFQPITNNSLRRSTQLTVITYAWNNIPACIWVGENNYFWKS